MPLVLLRGGSRDGESTVIDEHVRRLFAASEAPGMIDVYEASDEVAHVAGNDESAIVFMFVGQEPLPDDDHGIHLHMPHTRGYS